MKISVCIPTYNQSQYIETCVKSAYNQSVLPYEIIVFDDCSTDSTGEKLESLQVEIPILKVFRQPQNTGIVRNTNACLREGAGDFIVGLDSDDYLSNTYIEKLSQSLIRFPEACYAHANVQEIDQNGNFIKERTLFQKPGFQSGNQALHAARKGYRVAANIIMFRRSHLVKLNYFTDRPEYVQDYHLAAAAAALGLGNVYVNEILSFYRVWVDKGNVRLKRKMDEIIGLRKVFQEVLEPAYQEKGWGLSILKKNKANLACNQANCLSWDIYSEKERKELGNELRKLSSSLKLKLYAWMYLNGYGKIIQHYSAAAGLLRSKMKHIFLRFR